MEGIMKKNRIALLLFVLCCIESFFLLNDAYAKEQLLNCELSPSGAIDCCDYDMGGGKFCNTCSDSFLELSTTVCWTSAD